MWWGVEPVGGLEAWVRFGLIGPGVSVGPAVLELSFGPRVVVVLRKLLHQIRQFSVQINPNESINQSVMVNNY